jgi:hypothetical protein
MSVIPAGLNPDENHPCKPGKQDGKPEGRTFQVEEMRGRGVTKVKSSGADPWYHTNGNRLLSRMTFSSCTAFPISPQSLIDSS